MNVRVAVALSICLLSTTSDPAPATVAKDCHVGSYRLSDGKVVDIAPSDGETLRWTLWSGETGKLHSQPGGTWKSTFGWTDVPDGKMISLSDCNAGEIVFDREAGQRIAFDVADTVFESNGVKLVGRLVLPEAKGERVATRFAPGYFRLMADFIRNGCISGQYGSAEINMPARGCQSR